MLAMLELSIFLLLGRSEAGTSAKVGDGERGLAGIGEHAELFEFEVSEKGVASHPGDDPEGLNLGIPLWELDELLQNSAYRQSLQDKANFEAPLRFTL